MEGNHQCRLHSVKTILGTIIGVVCSEAKCKYLEHKGKIDINVVPLYKLHLVAASHSYILAQDGLDTVQPISSGLVRAVHANDIVTLR